MSLKCYWCDEKRQKIDKQNGVNIRKNAKNYRSINEETDEYLRENDKNYHVECYRQKMISSRKPLSEEEIESRIDALKVVMTDAIRFRLSRDKFYEWIKERYETNLPNYYVLRVDSISKGQDNKNRVYGVINFEEFLEMYQKLETYLNKVTYNINFKSTAQRMNYELEVVLGQYENYKKFKYESEGRQDDINKVEEKINESSNFTNVAVRVRSDDKSDDFHISDVVDEFF